MSNSSSRISSKAGLPPGVLMHVGRQKVDHVRIQVIDFSNSHHEEHVVKEPDELFTYKDKDSVSWINIDGLHDVELIDHIGRIFDLHPLLVEDILNTSHRPKAEDLGEYIFLTLRMLGVSPSGKGIVSEQVSFVLGKKWVLSFQEQEGDIFGGLRARMLDPKLRLRQKGSDYLFYRLVDTVIDHYFHVLDHFADLIEDLEERVLEEFDEDLIREIQNLKKQLMVFRKAVTPLREAMSEIIMDPSSLIEEGTQQYLMDAQQHLLHISESVDSQRDLIAGIMDLYMTGTSNKMNQIMKVLTIMATIFIPLTFIAGVYGMNFDHMPELHYRYGYAVAWGVMIAVFVVMIIYFRRKKWL